MNKNFDPYWSTKRLFDVILQRLLKKKASRANIQFFEPQAMWLDEQKGFGSSNMFYSDQLRNHDACALSVFYVTRAAIWFESTSGVTIERGHWG